MVSIKYLLNKKIKSFGQRANVLKAIYPLEGEHMTEHLQFLCLKYEETIHIKMRMKF